MGETRTQALARAFGDGKATAAQVVASAAAGARAYTGISGPSDDHDERMLREVRDESQSIDLNTWDGVSRAYGQGHLTRAQFEELYDAYMNGSDTSNEG